MSSPNFDNVIFPVSYDNPVVFRRYFELVDLGKKKKKIKKCKRICEEIKDISTERKNYHYTNFPALIEILKSGQLIGNGYYTKTKIGKLNDDSTEIATVRDSGVKRLEKSEYVARNLSYNIDGIKFTLYTDRILAGVRGIRLSPISELSRQLLYIKEDYKKMFGGKGSFPSEKELKDKNFNSLEYVTKNIKDKSKIQDAKNIIDQYIKNTELIKKSQIENREKEERFIHTYNNGGIPLDPKFMKIEIMKFPRREFWENRYEPDLFSHTSVTKAWENVHDLASSDLDILLKSSPNLLVRNEMFKKIIYELEDFKAYS